MPKGTSGKYGRHLIRLPWLKQGLFTTQSAASTFGKIRRSFETSGFRIAASDDRLLRICAYREYKLRQCTCVHVVWIRTYGSSTYISYGVEPRFAFFRLCRHGDHLEKLKACGSMIETAIDLHTHEGSN